MRTVLAGTVAATGLAAGLLVAAPATSAVAPTESIPSASQHQSPPPCVYKNNSGKRQPIKASPRRGAYTVGFVVRRDTRVGPCRSTTDGGKYKACGRGKSKVWTRVDDEHGWIKTRCFKRLR